jgi:hypothetical protein
MGSGDQIYAQRMKYFYNCPKFRFCLTAKCPIKIFSGEARFFGYCAEEVQLYAFDALAMDGDDLRELPLSMRKPSLARLIRRRPNGMFIAPFESGEIGPDLFRQACKFGLEGPVSKRLDRRYRAGRSTDWIKVKNSTSPAMHRAQEAFWLADGYEDLE